MNTFSLLIKPASADCNLRCKYCFYIDHLENVKNTPRMSDEVLETMITSYMQTNQNNNYAFGWQGGEPMIMGLSFFQKAVEFQKYYAPPKAVISNGLQTNGTLITDDFARFLGEYKFLLGVSLDGPANIHDYYRKTIGKKPTHNLVIRGIEHLRQNKIEFNILILVNNKNVKKANEIYHYLREQGLYYHQYIPCVEYNEKNNLESFSITGEEWGKFLCDLFDQWIKEDINKISIRLFDSILEYLVYGRYNVCHMGQNCCQYFVVEYDGSVYPCDFYVREDLLLGNILEDKWKDILKSPIYQTFGQEKSKWHQNCNSCPFINLCHGDCPKLRIGSPQSSNILSVLCKGWKKFYTHTLPRFRIIADRIKNRYEKNSLIQIKSKKVGRNSPCPCGSGKKYKNCCMR
ncbi:MAG: anaerobic sulfatase maturase [Candidatus Lokiarchaeota archaeon]|nr:anaerobic sulfatase maturase [Candidatus Lokiarchaeota archaeon]